MQGTAPVEPPPHAIVTVTCRRVEHWFARQGVPHFARKYPYKERLLFLVIPMGILIAFELGVAQWSNLDFLRLLLVPPVVIALAGCSWPVLSLPFRPNRIQHLLSRSTAFSAASLAIAAGLLASSRLPPLWSNQWVDFSTILTALAGALLLSSPDCWLADTKPSHALKSAIIVTVLAGSVGFALTDRLLTSPTTWLAAALPEGQMVPNSLPALLLLAFVAVSAFWLLSHAPVQHRPTVVTTRLHQIGRPASPLLLLILAFETAVLPYVNVGLNVQQEFSLLMLLIGVTLLFSWSRTDSTSHLLEASSRETSTSERIRSAVARPVPLAIGSVLYLFSYPALFLMVTSQFSAPATITLHPLSLTFTGAGAFVMLTTVNALYFLMAYVAVRFAVDRFLAWTLWAVVDMCKSATLGIARGIPLLLLFAGFLALTAETWQVSVRTPAEEFAGLVILLLASGMLCLWAVARYEVHTWSQFTSKEIKDQLLSLRAELGSSQRTPSPRINNEVLTHEDLETLSDLVPADDKAQVSAHLSWRGRMNARMILLAYEMLVFGLLTVIAACSYWTIGALVVSQDVGAEWVYGDNPQEDQVQEFEGMGQSPWLRVAVLLAVFSFLYLVVAVVTNAEQRSAFFATTEARLRRLLAVQAAYSLGCSLTPEQATGTESTAPAGIDGSPPQEAPSLPSTPARTHAVVE